MFIRETIFGRNEVSERNIIKAYGNYQSLAFSINLGLKRPTLKHNQANRIGSLAKRTMYMHAISVIRPQFVGLQPKLG